MIICLEKSPKNTFLKIVWAENFLRIFFGFSRGPFIMVRRLIYRLLNSAVWKPQKFSIIRKKYSSYIVEFWSERLLSLF